MEPRPQRMSILVVALMCMMISYGEYDRRNHENYAADVTGSAAVLLVAVTAGNSSEAPAHQCTCSHMTFYCC
jgi:hypothetical protein